MGLNQKIKERQKSLGITHKLLAKRCRVSIPDLIRVMESSSPSFGFSHHQHTVAITKVLGLSPIGDEIHTSDEVKQTQAKKKAIRIMRMVQGTIALESQGLTQADFDEMVKRTEEDLLSDPKKLWAVY